MALLSEGFVEDGIVECPWHGGAFDVRTGAAVRHPCVVDLRCYAVEIRDGDIYAGPANAAGGEQQLRKEKASHERPTIDRAGARRGRRGIRPDATIKFNFGDESVIYIDGKSKPDSATNEDCEAQIVISFTPETLTRILDKQLNPKVPLMTGRMKLRGDLCIAMRLDKVFGTG